jgi:fibronectin type 3 domain-containing protein
MKNAFKLFGIIALAVIIGFSMAACDDGSGNNNNGWNNNGDGNDNGNSNDNGNDNGNSGNPVTKLSAPTEVTARTLSSNTIRITWNTVQGATSYKVYYSSSSGQANPSQTTTVTTTSYERTSLLSDSTYYFKVAAVNSAGEGTASSIVSAKTNKLFSPGIPTGVSAIALSSSSIRISWSSPSNSSFDRPTGYYIYRSTSASGTFPYLTYTSSLSYTDTGLDASTIYYYCVKATNDNGDGSASSIVNATTMNSSGGGTSVPAAPTGVTATRNPAGSTTVRVSWNSVSGATSYKVYYSFFGSGSGTLQGSPTTTSFDSTNNITTETHYFRVSAVNSAGEGSPSSWVPVGPVAPASFNLSVKNSSSQSIEIQVWLEGHTEMGISMPIRTWDTLGASGTYTFTSLSAGNYRVQVRTKSPQGSWSYNPSASGWTSLSGNTSYNFTGSALQRL